MRQGKVPEQIVRAVEEFEADGVFHQREYEPFGVKRDEAVAAALKKAGQAVETFPGLSLFEPPEVLSKTGTPYTVFGPYKREWFARPADGPVPVPAHIVIPEDAKSDALPSAKDLKFQTAQTFECGGEDAAHRLLKAFLKDKAQNYDAARDVLSEDGTSLLSRHLHLGTLSARFVVDAVRKAGLDKPSGSPSGEQKAEHQQEPGHSTFLTEIAWHDFYLQILHHFPYVAESAFRHQYDALEWENDETLFEAWKSGKTGYPVVDAAMRQMNAEAWMHNRGRMIVASFLTKDLLIDWRWARNTLCSSLWTATRLQTTAAGSGRREPATMPSRFSVFLIRPARARSSTRTARMSSAGFPNLPKFRPSSFTHRGSCPTPSGRWPARITQSAW